MAKQKRQELTSNNLRNLLWDNLNALREGKIKADDANAMATQSREICRIVKLQLDAAKLSGKLTKTEAKKIML